MMPVRVKVNLREENVSCLVVPRQQAPSSAYSPDPARCATALLIELYIPFSNLYCT